MDRIVAVDRPVAVGNNTKEVAVVAEEEEVEVGVLRLLVGWHEPIQECRVVLQDCELYF